jgi:hypothetical protein
MTCSMFFPTWLLLRHPCEDMRASNCYRFLSVTDHMTEIVTNTAHGN